MSLHLHRFSRWITSKKFQTKILINSVCCTILAVAAAVTGTVFLANNAANKISKRLISKSVQQINLNIDTNFSQIESLLTNITVDQRVISILQDQSETGGKIPYNSQRILQEKMMQTQLINSNIYGIYICDSEGTAYFGSVSPSLQRNYCVMNEPWYPDLLSSRGDILLHTYHPSRYLQDNGQVVSLIQRLDNIYTVKPMAAIIVDIRTDLFDEILRNQEIDDTYTVLILDDRNQPVYSSDGLDFSNTKSGEIYQKINGQQILEQYRGSMNIDVDGEKETLVFSTSSKTGWKTVCCANINRISGFPKQPLPMALLISLITMVIAASLVILITMKNFRTLNQLKTGMDQVGKGNYNVVLSDYSDDEIGELCNTFNQMTAKLNYLINCVAKLEKEQQESKVSLARAELNALQSQINPHFIYNTLETIGMMAEINDDNETQKMSVALGKLIRISVKGDHVIYVYEELEHVRSYLLIQKIRMDDKFDVLIDMDSEILSCMIPKLILQPCIENSIYHGLENLGEKGHLYINGRKDNQNVIFTVSDNGVGIPPKELSELNASLHDKEPLRDINGNTHIGLHNVAQRIQLLYPGDEYGVEVKSTLGQGTVVYIRLPLVVS